jgi:hypothetical protein|nr:MAG TPA: hypothetical protein [Caudoviricetes sp.]
MRKFIDISTGEIITEEELRKEFEKLKKETPEEYDYSFTQYLLNCSETLDEIREWVGNAKVIYSLKELPQIGESDNWLGLVVSVALYDEMGDYVIYRVGRLVDDQFIDANPDIVYRTYAIHKRNIK